jgi:DNA-directed RNA polymerase specialized sigma24 family protein
MIGAAGRRARMSLDALTGLALAADAIEGETAKAVADLRAQGYSDREIGAALGVSPEAVGQRFGRKGAFKAEPAAGDAA